MAKFFGEIGYSETVEISPGVYEDQITEKPYYGDLVRVGRRLEQSDKVNNDIAVGNSVSIVSDPYAQDHIFAIRYVKWAGARWIVSNVEVQFPRLLLHLGGVYNGPTP